MSIRQRGTNNSQYGKCWIYNEKENKIIKKDELIIYLNNGWVKGRKMKFSNIKSDRWQFNKKIIIKCLCCEKNMEVTIKKSNKKFCSNDCYYHYIRTYGVSKETSMKISKAIKEKVKNGTHNGFPNRDRFYQSYPEQFFQRVLETNNIDFKFNMKCNRFFIDFAIIDTMIALEIDGKQHEIKERKDLDIIKDNILKQNGWDVYRIKWLGAKKMKVEIDKFLKYYNSKLVG